MPPDARSYGHDRSLALALVDCHAVLVKGEFRSRSPEGGPDSERVLGAGSYIVRSGGVAHDERNAGTGDLRAVVYFDRPVDFVQAEQADEPRVNRFGRARKSTSQRSSSRPMPGPSRSSHWAHGSRAPGATSRSSQSDT